MITVVRASSDDPLFIIGGGGLFWLTNSIGRPGGTFTDIEGGPAPVNFGERSKLGDNQVVHLNLEGILMPPLVGLSADASSYYAKGLISDDFNPYWRPLRGASTNWYQLERSPRELTVKPLSGVTVLQTWRLTTASWGNVVSPFPTGWRPYGYSASYVLLFRNSAGRLYYYVYNRALDYHGTAVTSKVDYVPPSSIAFQTGVWYANITLSAREYSWQTSSLSRVSTADSNLNIGGIFESGARLLREERKRIDYTVVDGLRSNMSNAICQQAKALDVNGIAYISDLIKIVADLRNGNITKAVSKISAANSFTKRVRVAADAYLASRYGATLTWSDTKKLVKSVQDAILSELKYRIARSSFTQQFSTNNPNFGSNVTMEEHCKCVYDPAGEGMRAGLSKLYTWDTFPTLENTWDLVPFSFVLDWFLPVGDFLNQYDNNILAQTLPIVDVMTSTKYTVRIPPKVLAWNTSAAGDIMFTEYTRSLGSTLPPIIPSFSGTESFHNVLEFGAIILQKLAR